DVFASIELHIEQGPILEREGAPLGVVSSIAGISRLRAFFSGRRDHAGTMPMNLRQDDGSSAAGTGLAIEAIASAGADSVGTVGEIHFSPEASNVVSEKAILSAELRSPNSEWFTIARKQVEEAVQRESSKRSLLGKVDWLPLEH